MADLTTLRSRVQLHVASCPFLVIDQALSDAAREFCRDTLAYRLERPVLIEPGIADYAVALGGLQVVQGIELRRAGTAEVLCQCGDHRDFLPLPARAPQRWALKGDRVAIDSLPVEAATLTLTVAVRPPLGGMALDDAVFDAAEKGIVAGAVSLVKQQPNQPWSDMAGAGLHRAAFEYEVAEQRNLALRGGMAGSVRVTPRRWV